MPSHAPLIRAARAAYPLSVEKVWITPYKVVKVRQVKYSLIQAYAGVYAVADITQILVGYPQDRRSFTITPTFDS